MDSKYIVKAVESWFVQNDSTFIDADISVIPNLLQPGKPIVRITVKTLSTWHEYSGTFEKLKSFINRNSHNGKLFATNITAVHIKKLVA